MGIVAFNWAREGNNQLTLVMNRDNWETRVIRGAFWDHKILGGECERNGGTWFGISERGRVAFLVDLDVSIDHVDPVNASEFYPHQFLDSNKSPQKFAEYVARRERQRHNNGDLEDHPGSGLCFNLIVADMTLNSMVHIRKPEQEEPDVIIQPVPFGFHTLTQYGGLDSTELPRDLRLRDSFNHLIGDFGIDNLPDPAEIARTVMYDTEGGEDAVFLEVIAEYPQDEDLGKIRFGTTSTTALAVERTGRARLFERYRLDGGWHTHDFDFQIQH